MAPGCWPAPHTGRQLHPPENRTCATLFLPLLTPAVTQGQQLTPAPPVMCFFTFLIQLDSFVTVCVPSWDPTSPKWTFKHYFKNLHTLSIPLCRVYGFDRCLILVFTITESYRMVLQLKKKKNPLHFLPVQSCLCLEPLATWQPLATMRIGLASS